ncbi:MAG: Zn-ribbon domain-containing OB-fold protein [Thermoleophilia bacterium]|nr:Zn-ribbon domain-containing OB-fold protein [Thermoleophilia bacterium]
MLPVLYELTEPFWAAAAEGKLLIQRCRSCGAHQWYPRGHCRRCLAAAPEWVESPGRGRVHTFTIVCRSNAPGFEVPYVFAIVELEEGVRLSANLVGIPHEQVACGLPVRVTYQRLTDRIALPQFTAAAS